MAAFESFSPLTEKVRVIKVQSLIEPRKQYRLSLAYAPLCKGQEEEDGDLLAQPANIVRP